MNYQKIKQIVEGIQTTDGAGVNLTRIIGSSDLNMLDPFLLLDEFGSDNPDDYIAGFPPHPHRGFETITYMLNGKWQHKDSAGNEGKLGEGSVQWMTAGRGIIHSEMPIQTDGLARGFQLWLNLPKDKKMIEPAYQDIESEQIPIVKEKAGTVKVISGEYSGTIGPGKSHTPVLILDIRINPNSEITIPVNDDWNAFAFI
ncbi:MAG: pirin family protein, partial [Candidatus Marinimicrobia bacterium]|nr:pirin family protein [Candidatus Neomarinimicrobiota bacterium]